MTIKEIERLRRIMKTMSDSFKELSEVWVDSKNSDEISSYLNEVYPFVGSLHELALDVRHWRNNTEISTQEEYENQHKYKWAFARVKVRASYLINALNYEPEQIDCEFNFLYPDGTYIGITEDSRYRALIDRSYMESDCITDIEDELWSYVSRDNTMC